MKYVEDFGGFNFSHIKGTNFGTFQCTLGVGICKKPKEDEKWKHQEVVVDPSGEVLCAACEQHTGTFY
jgi:hypothetical protein